MASLGTFAYQRRCTSICKPPPPPPTYTQTESLPVVVIVHVTQQPPAEATIFWDNAFAEAVSQTTKHIWNECGLAVSKYL